MKMEEEDVNGVRFIFYYDEIAFVLISWLVLETRRSQCYSKLNPW